jgi:hypothetical protein
MEMGKRRTAERMAFVHYLRTGWRLPAAFFATDANEDEAVSTKFNPWHDPDDGRFTFGPGGPASLGPAKGPLRANPAGRPVTPKPKTPPPTRAPIIQGPLQTHARQPGQAGDVARAVNKIVTDPNANVTLHLDKDNPTQVRRIGPNMVELKIGGKLKATGSFVVAKGLQQVSIRIRSRELIGGFGALGHIASFPDTITISSHTGGRLLYSLDKPIKVTTFIGATVFKQKAGVFNIGM